MRRVALAFLAVVLGLPGTLTVWAAESDKSKPVTYQDFRKQRLADKDDIQRLNLAPFLDEPYLLGRLTYLMRNAIIGDRPRNGVERIAEKQLSYHVVVRTEQDRGDPRRDPGPDGIVDVHIPGLDTKEGQAVYRMLSDADRKLITAVANGVGAAADVAGYKAEPVAERADLLIHVNLAERLQVSKGFNFEDMPRYSQRGPKPKEGTELKDRLYALPWTLVRLYYS